MLAKSPKGNLSAIWDAIAAHAEQTINRIVERQAPSDAEISESAGADWYLISTYPGDDLKAMRWLARRRFGVFRPMQQRRASRNNPSLVQGWEPVFPGWLFVFCWDIRKMRSRILSCPGVMGILCHQVSQVPIAINQEDSEGNYFIDKLRALSWVYDENAPVRTTVTVRAARHVERMKPKPFKINKRVQKKLDKLKKRLKRQGRWDASTWANANDLAPHERITLLMRTLNAPSMGPHAGP